MPSQNERVLGAAALAVLIVFVLPALFLMTGAVISTIMGRALRMGAEDDHRGSEMINLNY